MTQQQKEFSRLSISVPHGKNEPKQPEEKIFESLPARFQPSHPNSSALTNIEPKHFISPSTHCNQFFGYDNPEVLIEPFKYLEGSSTQNSLHSLMIDAFNEWLHVDEHNLQTIKRIVTMLYNASLLIDDIEDDSKLRYGIPVAHSIYGVPLTLNCANYVYFLSLSLCLTLAQHNDPQPPDTSSVLYQTLRSVPLSPLIASAPSTPTFTAVSSPFGSLSSPSTPQSPPSSSLSPSLPSISFSSLKQIRWYKAVAIFAEELLCVHRGQGRDIQWREMWLCPSESEYREMVLDKVGGLFRLGTKLMQLFSSDQRDFVPLANLLALFFQLIDDYNNLSISDTNTLKNKSFCEDLTEGKFSFPIIHSINSCKSDHRLLRIFCSHSGCRITFVKEKERGR